GGKDFLFRLTQFWVLLGHPCYRAMVLTNLYTLPSFTDGGCVPIIVQCSCKFTGYIHDRFICPREGFDISEDPFHAQNGEFLDSFGTTDFAQRIECFRSEFVIGMAELGSTFVCEAKVLGRSASPRCFPIFGLRTAIDNFR